MTAQPEGTPSTDTLEQARAHARSLAAASPPSGPTIPASAAVDLPAGVDPTTVVWDETVPGGNYASRVLRRDDVLTLTDVDGDACVQLLLFSLANPAERLNVADTVKVQWQAYLGPGALLLSDMGRALATLVTDTSARHDCLCGGTSLLSAGERWGDGSASGPTPNARDLLVLGGAKHGLGRIDIGPCINLFKGVVVGSDGSLTLDGAPSPGATVELRAELDLIVVFANTPHPLDARPDYTVTPVRCTARRAARPEPDPFRDTSPERLRAFQNTEDLLAEVGA